MNGFRWFVDKPLDHTCSQTTQILKQPFTQKLSDCAFAIVMAITFMEFELPETVQLLSILEVNQVLIGQLKTFGIHIIGTIPVALFSQNLSDSLWLLIPVVSPVANKDLKLIAEADVASASEVCLSNHLKLIAEFDI